MKTVRLTEPLSTKALQSVFKTVKTDIRLTSFSSHRDCFLSSRRAAENAEGTQSEYILRDKRSFGECNSPSAKNSVYSAALRENKNKLALRERGSR
jgi:hypothetical protein